MDDTQASNAPTKAKRVGYWMTEKKLRRLNFDAFEILCRSAGIEMVKLNFDVPLEQQGPFDVILHKLTDQLVHSPDGSRLTVKHMEAFQRYMAAHPSMKVLDPIENVMRLSDRRQQYQFVKECDVVGENCRYFIPSFTELTTSDITENKHLLAENGISYPIVCKPSLAHCNGQSIPLQADREEMSIIFDESGLSDVQPPCVVQTFVNHNARLFKIFIVGRRRFVIQRPSIKNLFAGDYETIFFNSNDVSKSYSSSHLNMMDESEVDYPIIEPDEKKMNHLVSGIQKKFGLELLGIDVIIENGSGRYGVIDINAFPGYDGVDEFFPSLLELIQCKISSADIPSVPNHTVDPTRPSDDESSAAETVHAKLRTELMSSSCSADADNVIVNVQQSSSASKWYYFSPSFCSEYMKSPTSCSQLEHTRPDGQSTVEHVVTVNGFTKH